MRVQSIWLKHWGNPTPVPVVFLHTVVSCTSCTSWQSCVWGRGFQGFEWGNMQTRYWSMSKNNDGVSLSEWRWGSMRHNCIRINFFRVENWNWNPWGLQGSLGSTRKSYHIYFEKLKSIVLLFRELELVKTYQQHILIMVTLNGYNWVNLITGYASHKHTY